MFTGIITRNLLQPARGGAGDRPAISLENERTWTYAELAERTNRYANGLAAQGVQAGDRVGMLLSNSLEYWAMYLAITRLGAIAVRLNWRLTGAELRYALTDSGTSVLCLHGRFAATIAPVLAETPVRTSIVFVLDTDLDADGSALPGALGQSVLEDADASEPAAAEPSLTDPCMIMYTSGTTGYPKGALWTHGQTLWFGAMQAMYWRYDERSVHLGTTPMFHVSGFEDCVLPVLMSGGHAVMMRSTGLTIDTIVGVLQHHRCTDVFLLPATIYQWMSWPELDRVDVPELRRVVTGGSPILGWAVDKIRTRFPQVRMEQAYGLTEGGAMTSVMDPERLDDHRTSVGRPLPLTEVKIVDPATLEELPADTDGELWTRSPSVCGVYWGKPEATAETFVDGWCRTGDLARITADGYIYIIGRVKDMILSGGENIYPAEIENILADHPAIQESAVIGVPDAKWDETPCAAIVLNDGHSLTSDEVIAYCRERLAGYKRPRYVVFVDALPRNASGKILKRRLREEYAHLGSAAARQA
ncbi:AMP-binding protein [Pseudonocardia acidicola]|uniref:Acyl--CoA ligase n=1 Tax=Pseudonocardia acidicola TaxID=2724939 RepID=A0ABX1SE41_9PSEU|nr:acyl--CoA ligase [Pseudonocardia acidicola]